MGSPFIWHEHLVNVFIYSSVEDFVLEYLLVQVNEPYQQVVNLAMMFFTTCQLVGHRSK